MQDSEHNQDGTESALSGVDRSPERASLPFRLALLPVALFIVTVLAFVAAQFGDARAPAQQWLNRNVGWLLAVEVAASVLLGTMAMAADRRRIVESVESRVENPETSVETVDP
jgi:hypothetical protein